MGHRFIGGHMLAAWCERGWYGVRYGLWQIDLRDHRRKPPTFSARELGRFCGHHVGPFCVRAGRLVRVAS